MMFSGLKKTGIPQNNNNGMRKRDRYQEVYWIFSSRVFNFFSHSILNFCFHTLQLKTSKPNAQNRKQNPSTVSSTHHSNNSNSTNNKLQSKPVDSNSSGNSNSSTLNLYPLPSYIRLGGGASSSGSGQRSNGELRGDSAAASSSTGSNESSSLMKYRSSISDLGCSSMALDRLTNTRIKSITNRRGAVKYQK